MILDPIADLLTRIRNANQRKHKTVEIPHSKIKAEIVKILLEEGYISDFKINQEGVKKVIVVTLKYQKSQKVITGLKRISKPGLRIYSNANDLPQVLNGFGIAIVSTSKGIVTAEKTRTMNMGGEVLAFVW